MSNENPVLLWGDLGPKVYALSQIYDPERSSYVLTLDTTPGEGKTYYRRERVDDTITFTEVTGLTEEDNPKELGLFEKVAGTDQEGTYVPMINSLVVVDQYTTDYQESTLLHVTAVDETTLKSTLKPVSYSSGEEVSPRAVDYGNERFMLYFDASTTEGGRVILTPDRKLMMYGRNEYYYKLYRKGVTIATTLPDGLKVEGNANIPYVSAASKRVNFSSAEIIASAAGQFADVYRDNGLLVNLLIPSQVDYANPVLDPDALLPTLDTLYKDGKTYFLKSGDLITQIYFKDVFEPTTDTVAAEGKTYYQHQAGDVYVAYPTTEGQSIAGLGLFEKTHAKNASVGDTIPENVYQKCVEALLGRIGYVYNKKESVLAHVYIPTSCQLDTDKMLTNGELITMEVYELRGTSVREVMSVTLTAKASIALDLANTTTRRIKSFDVELNGSRDFNDIWYLCQGDNINNWSFAPKLIYDDSSTTVVPIDNKTSFVFGLKEVKTDVVGKEYRLMFKFFPNPRLNVDWTAFKSSPTVNYITCYKTVKIINGLSESIRKVSLIPAWNNGASKYEFRYLIYKQDLLQPDILQELSTASQIVRFVPTTDKYVLANKSYYRYNETAKRYELAQLIVGALMPTGIFEEELIPGLATTVDGTSKSFGVVQHAAIAVQVQGPNASVNEVYRQPIAVKLQNMLLTALPKKWLLGDDLSGYEEALLPYGNDTIEKRPYLTFKKETDPSGQDTGYGIYQVSPVDFNAMDKFLTAFYRNANPPVGSYHESHTSYEDCIQPTHFIVRSICDAAVCSAPVQIEADLTVTGKPYAYPFKLSLGQKVTDPNTGTSYYKDDAAHSTGGHIPVKVTSAIEGTTVDLMGTVIVEFVYKTPTGEFKHLYGVPVEVRQA